MNTRAFPTLLRLALLALAAASAAGCISSAPGVVRTGQGNPIVTIGAGEATISGSGDSWRVWYVIDTSTQTCWIKLGDSGAELDCCKLRRVLEARPYLKWLEAGECTKAAEGAEGAEGGEEGAEGS